MKSAVYIRHKWYYVIIIISYHQRYLLSQLSFKSIIIINLKERASFGVMGALFR